MSRPFLLLDLDAFPFDKRFVWRFLDQIGLRERPSRLNGKEDEKEIGEKEV